MQCAADTVRRHSWHDTEMDEFDDDDDDDEEEEDDDDDCDDDDEAQEFEAAVEGSDEVGGLTRVGMCQPSVRTNLCWWTLEQKFLP